MFDNRRHLSTTFIYPYHHAPKAPHTGIVYGRALSNAYAAAQLGSPIVLSHAVSLPMTDPEYLREGELVYQTAPVPLVEGYRRIDGTHLVARVAYILPEVAGETIARHKLKVTGNSIETESDLQDEDVGVRLGAGDRATNFISGTLGEELGYSAFGSPKIQYTTLEVALDEDQIGQQCAVQILGCATNAGGTAEYGYRLMGATVFQEFR